MNNLITDLENIKKELTIIQEFIEITPSEEITEIEDRGNQLIVYIARTSKLLADAKYHKNEKLNSTFINEIKKISGLSPSIATKYVDSLCKDENYLIDWCERLNRACTHGYEWVRSLLSKSVQEWKYNHFNSR